MNHLKPCAMESNSIALIVGWVLAILASNKKTSKESECYMCMEDVKQSTKLGVIGTR
ncbi:hypothetical protein M758_3G194900 [Ceratodon purpureus]|uniref:Uncharacterized protein n=1 Tax=Ceratodon purpureus TaxID=3225 RepID=A0A8T0IN28_CERPU|nr:hypothetical protein KC19_3G195700 [Ceratodon purpureus]KAG0623707.1 hypothetical protein M758_3G194900 [Ceratodon purpureus]